MSTIVKHKLDFSQFLRIFAKAYCSYLNVEVFWMSRISYQPIFKNLFLFLTNLRENCFAGLPALKEENH